MEYSYPKVGIVVLNWNAWETTGQCVDSIRNLTYPNYEILIVDNGSTIPTPKNIQDKYVNCSLLETGENLGYTGGNNFGIRSALSGGAAYVLILNNDAVINDPDMLTKLVNCFHAIPAAGIVAPRLMDYRPNGILVGERYVVSRSVQFLSSLVTSGRLKGSNADSSIRSSHLSEKPCFPIQSLEIDGHRSEAMNVPFVSGAVMLISREVLEVVGLLDERLFMYDDETDLCLRVIEAGFEILYVRNTCITRVTCIPEDMPAYRAYLQGRNRFRIAYKRQTWFQSAVFIVVHVLSSLRTAVVLLKCKRWSQLLSLISGVRDGIIQRWGVTPKLRKLLAVSYPSV